jgi:hypothetical protein
MDRSRQEIVKELHRLGLHEVADSAAATLDEQVDQKTVEAFCDAHGISKSTLTDRMGGSP